MDADALVALAQDETRTADVSPPGGPKALLNMPPTVDGRTRHPSHPQAERKSNAAVADAPPLRRHHVSPRLPGRARLVAGVRSRNMPRRAQERGPRWGLAGATPAEDSLWYDPRHSEEDRRVHAPRGWALASWYSDTSTPLWAEPRSLGCRGIIESAVGARGLEKKMKRSGSDARPGRGVHPIQGVTHQPNGQRELEERFVDRRCSGSPEEAHGLATRGGTGCGSVFSGHARNPPAGTGSMLRQGRQERSTQPLSPPQHPGANTLRAPPRGC